MPVFPMGSLREPTLYQTWMVTTGAFGSSTSKIFSPLDSTVSDTRSTRPAAPVDVALQNTRAIASAMVQRATGLGIYLMGFALPDRRDSSDPSQLAALDSPDSLRPHHDESRTLAAPAEEQQVALAGLPSQDRLELVPGLHGPAYAEFRRRFESSEPVECCRRCGADWSL